MVLVSALKEELEKQFFIARQISLFCGVTRYPPVKPQAHRNISIFILFYKEELNLNFCARQVVEGENVFSGPQVKCV